MARNSAPARNCLVLGRPGMRRARDFSHWLKWDMKSGYLPGTLEVNKNIKEHLWVAQYRTTGSKISPDASDLPKCPRCHELNETQEHLLKCWHVGAHKKWYNLVRPILKNRRQKNLCPVQEAIRQNNLCPVQEAFTNVSGPGSNLQKQLYRRWAVSVHDFQWHQGREIIVIGALENGSFCTVFSENFHKFYPLLQYSIFFPSQYTSLLYKILQLVRWKMVHFALFLVKISINFSPSYSTVFFFPSQYTSLLYKILQLVLWKMVHFALFLVKISINFNPSYSTVFFFHHNVRLYCTKISKIILQCFLN
jgi:hypothetical protein